MRGAVGLAAAAFVLLLGWLAARSGHTPEAAAEALRALGTLMTLIAGVFSAVWWHQSADLSNRLARQDQPDAKMQRDANILNGAAATSTALALFASVFTALDWTSLEGCLTAICFIVFLAISGDEIGQAMVLSYRAKVGFRSVFGFLVLVVAVVLFIYRHVSLF